MVNAIVKKNILMRNAIKSVLQIAILKKETVIKKQDNVKNVLMVSVVHIVMKHVHRIVKNVIRLMVNVLYVKINILLMQMENVKLVLIHAKIINVL